VVDPLVAVTARAWDLTVLHVDGTKDGRPVDGRELAIHIALPPDARATGYRNGELELWLSPSARDSAYLRVGDDVERWPRADPVVACA
jgi:hypothetical protein